MGEEPAFDSKPNGAVRIIEEHWPSAADGTPLLPVETDQSESFPLMTDAEWQAWQQIRAADKAWELANWDKWCQEIDNLFK